MKLYDIIKDVAKTSLPDMEISDVTSDTRKAVKAGSMFVCIKGKTFDGHDAAKDDRKGLYSCSLRKRSGA